MGAAAAHEAICDNEVVGDHEAIGDDWEAIDGDLEAGLSCLSEGGNPDPQA